MAAPVISSTTSILQYLQFESWQFQPTASNDPTAWNCTPLPAGLSFNNVTGLLSGAALFPGVYIVTITATNGDGTSSGLVVAIGIQAASGEAQVDGLDLTWDMETGLVTCDAAPGIVSPLNDGTTAKPAPIAWLKSGDIRMIHITPVKQGVVLPIVFTSLVINLKEDDGDGVIATSVAFVQVSTRANNLYRVALDLTQAAMAAAIESSEDDHYADAGSEFVALAEIQATYTNTLTPSMDGGPSTLQTSSLDFGLGIQQAIAA
jgi:hypothetical protein